MDHSSYSTSLLLDHPYNNNFYAQVSFFKSPNQFIILCMKIKLF